MSIRQTLIDAFKSHAKGHIDKHVANVEVYLNNPVGVGEHPDTFVRADYRHVVLKYLLAWAVDMYN